MSNDTEDPFAFLKQTSPDSSESELPLEAPLESSAASDDPFASFNPDLPQALPEPEGSQQPYPETPGDTFGDPVVADDPFTESNPDYAQTSATPTELAPELEELQEPLTPLIPTIPAAQPHAENTIEQVRQFSEKVAMEKVSVPAAFPFSLLIEGQLMPEEREKLLDVISRENMGFREVDLEPQFSSNRVLIPRISEYAGILLVQALRATRAKIRLGPSDSIYATQDTQNEADPMHASSPRHLQASQHQTSIDSSHPAEAIAITSGTYVPELPDATIIDTLTATTILEATLVETENSAAYQEILDNLQRELKYKAWRRGAYALTHFAIHLLPLRLANQYRLTLSGTAVKPQATAAEWTQPT